MNTPTSAIRLPRAVRPTSRLAQQPAEDAVEEPRADGPIDVPALADALLGRWKDERLGVRELIKDPALYGDVSLPYGEQRERVLGQLGILVENRAIQRAFPDYVGGENNPGGNVAGFEELVAADPSLQIKAGVQWGLFGAAVHQLGTEEHHRKWLPDIISLKTPGAFAMTEIGHGSDVASIATTATYDPETEEFVINTPFRAAWKDYLGNAALHGQAATVFAQLITQGVNHGVHCFYVPIRTPEGELLPGVQSEDDGHKGGLNGIDNGRLAFDHVRVPRTNLLNRYGDVAADGTYTSPIESPGRRFFTMLGTLVQGRVSLDGASTNAAKIGLTIALRYAYQRRQFKGAGGDESTLMSYQLHRRRLIPLLAQTYAAAFAHHDLLETFHGVFTGEKDTPEQRAELETLAAALKPLSTWNALETLQECREACGGSGFLSANRITGLYRDLDVYVTFEGDNHVLLQLVAKRLLGDYSKEFAGMDVGTLTKYVTSRAEDLALNRSGLRRAAQTLQDTGDTRKSANALKDPAVQAELLRARVHTLIASAAEELKAARKLPEEQAAEVFNSQQVRLIEAARAHGQLLQWEALDRAAGEAEGSTAAVLTSLRDLFGMTLIEKNLGWYLSHGLMSARRARTLEPYILRLIDRIEPHVLDLLDAFGYEQEHLRADISSGVEQERQDEARDYYRRLRASHEAPVDEKVLAKKAAAKSGTRKPGARRRGGK